ncbi:DEAD/DEAH box helicase [Acetobacter persici]|uniref:DEAD/DEAH box helicase n=1 Tax=Acetobacter persici TaxID=1076596 RepID=UPI0012FE0742|nr:AAA domain-containing protein [Acetobacter persici]
MPAQETIRNPDKAISAPGLSTSSGAFPERVSEAQKAIRSWISLEILTPEIHPDGQWANLAATYGGKICPLSDIQGDNFRTPTPEDVTPWASFIPPVSDPDARGRTPDLFRNRSDEDYVDQKGQSSRKKAWYHIVLGAMKAAPSLQALNESFGDNSENEDLLRQPRAGQIIAATVVLNESGHMVTDTLSLASFAWGVGHMVETRDASSLRRWRTAQSDILLKISNILAKTDDCGVPIPLTWEDLCTASAILADELKLPPSLWMGVQCAIVEYRVRQPSADILSSLYLGDLQKVEANLKTAPTALQEYMGIKAPRHQWNALRDRNGLRKLLYPGMFTLASWPGPGLKPLNLLQQAAVNNICFNLSCEGMESVNGPPGTGKTTLLRDIIAHVMVRRAEKLVGIKNPSYGPGNIDLLDCAIIVASSNNAAVDNISMDLPLRSKALDPSVWKDRRLDHFGDLASYILGLKQDTPEEERGWGVISAKLGNFRNRKNFFEKFWWDQNWGLSGWLGQAAAYNIAADKSAALAERYPPPGRPEALARWDKARDEFQQKFDRCLQIRETLSAICDVREATIKGETDIPSLVEITSELKSDLESADRARRHIEQDLAAQLTQLASETSKLNSLSDLSPSPAKDHRILMQIGHIDQVQNAVAMARLRLESAAENQKKISDQIGVNQRALRALKKKASAKSAPESGLDDPAVQEGFWSLPDAEFHTSSPWNSGDFKQAREDLFIAAVNLHHAFIVASAKHVRRAINAVAMNEAKPQDWGLFFLTVPVVSTTFASFGRMFGVLKPGSLGWLLLDEGGQATPQAAVGSIARSKRVVVIGDQQQIEPVVPIPPTSTSLIFKENGSPPERWAPPRISAQTLADRANEAQGRFKTDSLDEIRRTGFPLLVHRRCDSIMFGISNEIAYGGSMIHATEPAPSIVRDYLGDSVWVDVKGPTHDKWVETEGRVITRALSCIAEKMGDLPDVYVICPYRQPIRRLKQMIRSYPARGGFKGIDRRSLTKWLASNVGTIHTFQGKQAEGVFLMLGAGTGARKAARSWAGNTPNILNVAASRAQRCFYIIGNETAWKNVGSFKVASKRLKTVSAGDWIRHLDKETVSPGK